MAENFNDGISTISGATLEKARRELREVPEHRAEAIQELRRRIGEYERNNEDIGEDGVRFARKDDKFLLRFLRARKFNMDRALQLYANYYRYRHKHAHLFTDFHPKAVENAIDAGIFGVLDQRLKNGSKVITILPPRWDYNTIHPEDCFKLVMLIFEKLADDEETQVHGVSVFDNMEGSSLALGYHFMRTEFVHSRVLVELQDAFPMRFKGLHFFHPPWYISIIMKLVRPLLKQKHRDRIHNHGSDYRALYDFIEPRHLPAQFGGFLPPLGANNLQTFFKDELTVS